MHLISIFLYTSFCLHVNRIYSAKIIFTVAFNIRKMTAAESRLQGTQHPDGNQNFCHVSNFLYTMTILFIFGDYQHLKIIFRKIEAPQNRVTKPAQDVFNFVCSQLRTKYRWTKETTNHLQNADSLVRNPICSTVLALPMLIRWLAPCRVQGFVATSLQLGGT